MSDDARSAIRILNRLVEELQRREREITTRLDYYEGRHKICYASPEFQDYFVDRFEGFADNWCAPVISGPTERMNILGIRVDDADRKADKDLSRAWRAADCERGSSEAFVVALAAARSYCLVWGNPADEETPRVTWERPDQAIVGYDSDTGERAAGLKLWRDDTTEYATLYLPDEVWKFSRPAYARSGYTVAGLVVPDEGTVRSRGAGAWEPRQGPKDDAWPIPNPLGVVPLIEMRNQTLLDDKPLSDISGVIAMQDAINLTWAYLMNALDFASLPQRVVMGTDVPMLPVLDSNGQVIGKRPLELDQLVRDRILWIPGEKANIGQWSAADLSAYSGVIERAIEHIAAQTRTPPHYLIGRVANLSAEALTAAETGLTAKTNERIVYVQSAVREVFALMASVMGDDAKADACRSGTVIWRDVQFRAMGQKVDALMKLKSIGFPLRWIAEQYGLEPPEVDRVMQMAEDQAAMDPFAQAVNGKPDLPASPPTAQPGGDPFQLEPAAAGG
ncbi:phage portal protein [Microtetraspora sp. AC03309]|uniref:phage portal protein n=1 Tax=Microtetraspora sp. AC03309 TaxID=2779376 RepID=UPI001E6478E6|nr:phage portal protein [Microtetraspora sp. AC03309]